MKKNGAMHIKVFLSLLVLASTSAYADRPVRSLLEYRQEALIMQQWDSSCGAAALATLFTYYLSSPVSEREVAQGMLQQTDPLKVQHRGGFSLLDMQRYADKLGYKSDGYSGMTLEDLAERVPVIVPIRARGYDHFVIVRHVKQSVDIADPGFGNYKMDRAKFLAAWPGIGFQVK